MSTRSTTIFPGYTEGQNVCIYRHYDGYPEGAGKDIFRFFDEVKADTNDCRFDDPAYLAAKYVVFLAREFTKGAPGSLDFLGVGVVSEPTGDTEYIYTIDTQEHDEQGRPMVYCTTADGEDVDLHEWSGLIPSTAPKPHTVTFYYSGSLRTVLNPKIEGRLLGGVEKESGQFKNFTLTKINDGMMW